MEIKKIDRDDVEEIFVWIGVLLNARHCDNAVALDRMKILLEKYKKAIGFSKEDEKKIKSVEDEYGRRIAVLKESKKKEEGEKSRITLDERSKIFMDIVGGH
ncbi:MAG: hypothetical protein NUV64_03385 [Parcubacteria group bacterium]|nr:hypothetical protein [Parcubacteria group bacterium]MCR4342377.1 hypothetical protein [Patescibacteria group bacterium]